MPKAPVTDGKHLFIAGLDGVVYSLDALSGRMTWKRKLPAAPSTIIKLGSDDESEQVHKELQQRGEEAAELLQYLQESLDPYIKEVRLTNRLKTSPVRLVGSELDYEFERRAG